jgi:hypothetical protein
MSPRRFAIVTAALCGTVILAGCVIAAVARFGLADIKDTHAAPIEHRSAAPLSVDTRPGDVSRPTNADAVFAAVTVTGIGGLGEAEASAEVAPPDSSQMLVPEKSPVRIATVGTPEPVQTDDTEPVSSTNSLDESLPDSSQTLAPETPHVPIATVNTPEPVHTDDTKRVSSTKTLDECSVQDVCIDQYLWSVYQRTPKFDTVKVVERRKKSDS